MVLSSIFQRFPVVKQLMKFAVVGAINTGVDFLVLNLEMALTGITSGTLMLPQNSISFAVATTNSYLLNKRWTFEDSNSQKEGSKFSQFLGVSLIGVIINSSVVYAITTFVSPIMNISPQLWANVAKLLATGVSLIWNFLGYKFIVFKK